jgi:arylsulfatase A-like enzyme
MQAAQLLKERYLKTHAKRAAIQSRNLSNRHMAQRIIQAGLIWGIGWYFFGATEAIIKLITETPLQFSAVLLSVSSYCLFGFAAGMLFAIVQSFMVKQWQSSHQECGEMYSMYAGFIVSVMLAGGLAIINTKLLAMTSQIVFYTINLVYFVACAALYPLLFRVFSAYGTRTAGICCIAITISLYVLLPGGLFINETLLQDTFADLTVQRLLINGAVVAAAFIIFLITFVLLRLLRSAATFIRLPDSTMLPVFFIVTVAGSLVYIGSQTQRDNYLNQLTTILKQRPNIFIISLDTTRRDHLSCYGYQRKTTPHVDSLVPESLLFSRAYAPSSWTLPSHASLFTGCYPAMHGADRAENTPPPYFCKKLGSANLTIAEILAENGYQTFGVVAGALCSSKFGMGQGFAYFNDSLSKHGDRSAEEVSSVVLTWLYKEYSQGNQQRFLLFNMTRPVFGFIHYFDPHHPYRPPPPFDTMYPGRDDRIILHYGNEKTANYPGQEWKLLTDIIKGNHVITEAEKSHLLSQYDGEIAYMDSHAGRVLDALRKLKIFHNSMIIVISDHGEFFGEHNLALHGTALYEEMIHVPLIIKYPSWMKKTGTVDTLVSLVDVMPEILKTVSIFTPQQVQGRPVDVENKNIIAENQQDPTWKSRPDHKHLARDLKVIYRGSYKYIWASDGSSELYDIAADPHEQKNLIHIKPEQTQTMNNELEQWVRSFQPVQSDDDSVEQDKTVIEQLRGLGYIQ